MNTDGTATGTGTGTAPGSTAATNADGLRKKRVRGGHRAHLTKMLTEVTTQMTGYEESRESTVLTLKSCLERKAGILSKLDAEILEEIDDGAQMEVEIDQAEAIQNQIQEAIIKIDWTLKKAAKPDIKPDIKPAQSSDKRSNMKLPKYQITFDRDPKKYHTFRDLFGCKEST